VVVGDIYHGSVVALKYETGKVILQAIWEEHDLGRPADRGLAINKAVAMGDMRLMVLPINNLLAGYVQRHDALQFPDDVGPLSTFPGLWAGNAGLHVWRIVRDTSFFVVLAIGAINKALGMVTLRVDPVGTHQWPFQLWELSASEPWRWPNHLLTVHRSALAELRGMGD
jgi:hypothetical protein